METKFTPGPWYVDAPHPSEGLARICHETDDSNDELIAAMPNGPDAHLMGAALELYQALEDLIDEIECSGVDLNRWSLLAKARAALAKARGEGFQPT